MKRAKANRFFHGYEELLRDPRKRDRRIEQLFKSEREEREKQRRIVLKEA